jgi:hypothetical protein
MNLSGGSKISAALYTLFSLSYRQVTARPGLGALARGLRLRYHHDRLHQRDRVGADWGSSHRPSCCWSPSRVSRGCSPLPCTRSSGQGTWLCVQAEPSLAQGVRDRPDERRGGLCSAPSPLPGPVRPSGWCRQGNGTTWGRLSRCGDGFHYTVMNSTTRRRPAVALTRGDGFYDTTTANGGGDQRQRLPRHGEGKWQSQQVAMASTSRQRPTAASTVSSDLGLMGLNLDSFFIFKN